MLSWVIPTFQTKTEGGSGRWSTLGDRVVRDPLAASSPSRQASEKFSMEASPLWPPVLPFMEPVPALWQLIVEN